MSRRIQFLAGVAVLAGAVAVLATQRYESPSADRADVTPLTSGPTGLPQHTSEPAPDNPTPTGTIPAASPTRPTPRPTPTIAVPRDNTLGDALSRLSTEAPRVRAIVDVLIGPEPGSVVERLAFERRECEAAVAEDRFGRCSAPSSSSAAVAVLAKDHGDRVYGNRSAVRTDVEAAARNGLVVHLVALRFDGRYLVAVGPPLISAVESRDNPFPLLLLVLAPVDGWTTSERDLIPPDWYTFSTGLLLNTLRHDQFSETTSGSPRTVHTYRYISPELLQALASLDAARK